MRDEKTDTHANVQLVGLQQIFFGQLLECTLTSHGLFCVQECVRAIVCVCVFFLSACHSWQADGGGSNCLARHMSGCGGLWMANGVIDAVSRATGLCRPLGGVVERGKRGVCSGGKSAYRSLNKCYPSIN